MLTDYFLPTWLVDTIYSISPQALKSLSVKGIITDLDNTLIAWDFPDATQELIEWVKEMQENGIEVMILSNNNEQRVKHVADQLQVPYYSAAFKPFRKGIRHLLKISGLKEEEVIIIGDQLLTDIFVANRQGLRSVLVRPVTNSDSVVTRINRRIESFVFNGLKRRYSELKWRDRID
ncbi:MULTISPECIES: YqeG family HAD IIIA-type phosphatase [Aerococcus]|uniref:YqeG family HAD IIIA-type phosphatase n=2 Tax=Aerococcus TaxID=1375 RepID=A0ABT4C3S8_9LACT|nr:MULTISPECIES: YqeG family HAD IIIA-type phosphatase [Aerococcus]AEA01182.1 HAD phosphatase, family IIIA [Aerococcus sp. Group 1]AMB95510.1 HAD family hydrolase [Aerococcus urinae]KAA9242753.1 YqeG family HAD IIIA-type phosphatase [Aerococcus urinae]KAA9299874.1 YqeG family HAD IIIA-type phosphatase [Aerococcus tenax]MCY3032631.1 YqeG family HAD IIIA-type phosphatase [Aerococcus urinae]